MHFYVEIEEAGVSHRADLENVITFENGRRLCANLKDARFQLDIGEGRRIYLFGDVFYHLSGSGDARVVDSEDQGYLRDVFAGESLADVITTLEGQYLGLDVDAAHNSVKIFSDRYGRLDSFYANAGADLYFGTDLDFIFSHVDPEYDQQMLVHLFSVYGWYTPKGLTIYRNVKQLRIGEILMFDGVRMDAEIMSFNPQETENYADDSLEAYYRILRQSVTARAASSGETWVASSSGWDSSMLLGVLANELGPEKVRMITGSMKYSKQTEVINQFEIDKINKIGEFYGIKPEIVDFDFASHQAPAYWQNMLPYYKSKHNYAFTSFNFSKLSDGLAGAAGKGAVIFNGETSDSFHNFGFSQFGTFFHTSKSFTEYADKMNCYLFGPSFFKKALDGTYTKDKIFQIFQKMNPGVEFSSSSTDRSEIIRDFLFPLFYGGPRIPLAATWKNPLLTVSAQLELRDFPFTAYMPDVLTGISDKNIYSWYIYLYQHLHSQGSTVNTPRHAMEFHDHRSRMPFNDIRMIELLSKAPESWGRGLDLNNTKYPLKWVAKNKIKFPYALLEEGPHSYLYDVIEGFSLVAEIIYRSGMTDFLKETFNNRAYRQLLSDQYFDLAYLDRLVDDFLAGREASGIDFTNLISLMVLSVVGWY